MTTAFLVTGARTPFGRQGGTLAHARPDDLAATTIKAAITRAAIDPRHVDEVVLGCANQAGEDNRNVARMAMLLAGLPVEIPAYTVNRLCASGLPAVTTAAHAIEAGAADIVVAGGVESMTRAPWVMAKAHRAWQRPPEFAESSLGWRFTNPAMDTIDDGDVTISMGETAERVADLDGIDRDACEAFALRSHQRAISARSRLAEEIVPVTGPEGEVRIDEGPRDSLDLERLRGLRPAFRADGVHTAGSSSPLSDGAAAVVVASGTAVDRLGLQPLARIVGSRNVGTRPSLMGLGPVEATKQALDRAGWTADSIDAAELNEAFAAQALACIRRIGLNEQHVNSEGGAIALGHPLGASGARLALTIARRVAQHSNPQARGVATLCVGVGQGVSLLVEAC